MTISRDSAGDMLSKWAAESSSVFFILHTLGMDVSFAGTITIPANGVIHLRDGHGLEATFVLSVFTEFEYADTRELPEAHRAQVNAQVSAWMSMQSECLNCIVCELKTD